MYFSTDLLLTADYSLILVIRDLIILELSIVRCEKASLFIAPRQCSLHAGIIITDQLNRLASCSSLLLAKVFEVCGLDNVETLVCTGKIYS